MKIQICIFVVIVVGKNSNELVLRGNNYSNELAVRCNNFSDCDFVL